MSAAAEWQELHFTARKDQVEPLEDWLFTRGALSVTLEDEADQPLLEPGPGETPLWDAVRLTALFAGHEDLAPLLGDVPARRLIPRGDGPNPAILALPGHPSQPDATSEFADHHQGRRLAAAGYDVLILSPRAYVGMAEHLATTEMLCAGLSMVAIRHLEALVLKRVLTSLREAGIVTSIGLMGHSGGAVHANALARWDHSFDYLVTDHFWPYVDVGRCQGDDSSTCIADSNCPALLPYAESIESKEEPEWAMPITVQEYGYPDLDQLLGFLAEHAE